MTEDKRRVNLLHWNYFLALERDLEVASRYVEFDKANFKTYSIELARLLFAAASEVDVLAKALCALFVPSAQPADMDEYRVRLVEHLPKLMDMEAVIPRYGLSFAPWKEWRNDRNPDWWTKYNDVKHQRDRLFHEGNLRSALLAMSGLLTITFQFYRYAFTDVDGKLPSSKATTDLLDPKSSLLLLPGSYYYDNLVTGYDNEPTEYFTRPM
jgi:hypothetical protein